MVDVFREVRRVLRDDGALLVNLGDSYWGSWGNAGNRPELDGQTGDQRPKDAAYINRGGWDERRDRPATSYGHDSLKAGDQCLIPHRVALALQADGWILRDTLSWIKKSPMPQSQSGWHWRKCRIKVASKWDESHPHPSKRTDEGFRSTAGDHSGNAMRHAEWADCPGCEKCIPNGGYVLRRGAWRHTSATEFVFMFTKSMDYFADQERAKERSSQDTHPRRKDGNYRSAKGRAAEDHRDSTKRTNDCPEKRNPRNWMLLSNEPSKEKHFAAYPSELVRRCLIGFLSAEGCCSICGAQYAPVVEHSRVATRPALNPKEWRADAYDAVAQRSEASPNRDPQRHVAISKVTGYRPCCECVGTVARPVVLDPFAGTAQTGRVAIHLGADFIGCELSEEYALGIAVKRLSTPWSPKPKKEHKGPKNHKPVAGQKMLF